MSYKTMSCCCAECSCMEKTICNDNECLCCGAGDFEGNYKHDGFMEVIL